MFVPALRPPDEAPRAAAWFAFRGDRLLVRADAECATLPDYDSLAALGATFESGHYLGRLADVDCYAVQLDEACECPDDAAFEGLRALYGKLPDDYFTIAGRAIQILHWDQTHRFCGRCGEPTAPAPAE